MEFPSVWKILLTVIILFLLRIIFRFFVKPYIMLQSLKKVKGAVCIYNPIMGLFSEWHRDFKLHNDLLYSSKKRMKDHPEMKFLATTAFDSISIELFDTELVKEFCSQITKNFAKDTRVYGLFHQLMMEGLLMSDGERWKSQKKVISQAFHFEYMNRCIPVVNKTCQEWIKLHCKDSPRSAVNISEQFKIFTASVVWQIFFGEESITPGGEADKMIRLHMKNIYDMTILTFSPINMLFGASYFKLGIGALERQYYREGRIIEEYYKKRFANMKKRYLEEKSAGVQQGRPKNLVELLLDEKMKDSDILAQVYTFLNAGTDTTHNMIVMCEYLLAAHPEVQEKLRQEIKECLGDAEITYDHLAKMKYLDAVIKEALRCYSPAWFQQPRIALQDTKIGDLLIKKGYSVYSQMTCIHHDPKNFPNPDEFRPERWLEKRDPGMNDPFAFIPFAAGRKCIAEQLAYIEAKVMTCELVRRFRFTVQQPFQLKMGLNQVYEAIDPITLIFEEL